MLLFYLFYWKSIACRYIQRRYLKSFLYLSVFKKLTIYYLRKLSIPLSAYVYYTYINQKPFPQHFGGDHVMEVTLTHAFTKPFAHFHFSTFQPTWQQYRNPLATLHG